MSKGKFEGMVALPVSEGGRPLPFTLGAFKVDRSPPPGTKMLRVVAHAPEGKQAAATVAQDLCSKEPAVDPNSPGSERQIEDAAEALARLGMASPFLFSKSSPIPQQPDLKKTRLIKSPSWAR
eukprot:TRINITY_DN56625_c0_g1_i1.p2 TRINITY_DN56625_c0_g1~~TRINITY_DN56625_c0_g1_i1.p2  ORF type:complete len:123 (-),score=34.81 TRINITY_DN56625_c0_g1_i1:475-843(-)